MCLASRFTFHQRWKVVCYLVYLSSTMKCGVLFHGSSCHRSWLHQNSNLWMKINEFIKYEKCPWNWSLTSIWRYCMVIVNQLDIKLTQLEWKYKKNDICLKGKRHLVTALGNARYDIVCNMSLISSECCFMEIASPNFKYL